MNLVSGGMPSSGTSRLGSPALRDRFGRRVDYLRLSATDRCNLRCSYCMPSEGVGLADRKEVLSWKEMLRLCRLLAMSGVRKIRVTGGEPLVRPGAIAFLERLRGLPGSPEPALTTNATLLERHAGALARIGVDRVNVSLDSLRRDAFARMTGRDLFNDAWRGIESADAHGLKIKLNVVIVAGVNDGEIADFVELTAERCWTVRFIEAMPFDGLGGRSGDLLDGEAILHIIRNRFPLERSVPEGSGVEELYRVPGFAGRVGLIRGRARSFCGECSRLRIDAAGRLRTCLYAEPSLDLRALLRGGATPEEIQCLIAEAVWGRHSDGRAARAAAGGRNACSMSRIGG